MADYSAEDMLKKAMLDIEKTNKRVQLMRKKVFFVLVRILKEWKTFRK